MWLGHRGREQLSPAGRLPRGRRDLRQRDRLLHRALPGERRRSGQLQSATWMQGHLRTLFGAQGLLFEGVRRRRALPRRGWMLSQGRALPVQRRLLLGYLSHGPRGSSSVRGCPRLQGQRRGVQEIRGLLRRRCDVRHRWSLHGGHRVPSRGSSLFPGHGLLLGCVRAEYLGQVGLPRFLRPDRRPMHRHRGLLFGNLRRFSRALFARPIGRGLSDTRQAHVIRCSPA